MDVRMAIGQLDWYFQADDGIAADATTKDAYESLKTAAERNEEPIVPKKVNRYMDINKITKTWYSPDTYDCGYCGKELISTEDCYCRFCGRRIDWRHMRRQKKTHETAKVAIGTARIVKPIASEYI